jgi:hypothetical protein
VTRASVFKLVAIPVFTFMGIAGPYVFHAIWWNFLTFTFMLVGSLVWQRWVRGLTWRDMVRPCS